MSFRWICKAKGCDRPSSTRTWLDADDAQQAARNHKRQRVSSSPGAERRRAHRVVVEEVEA